MNSLPSTERIQAEPSCRSSSSGAACLVEFSSGGSSADRMTQTCNVSGNKFGGNLSFGVSVMPEPFHLDSLFRRYPDWPLLREAARQWRRELGRRRACGAPLKGAFYWIPLPLDTGQVKWEVREFFDDWLPSSDHVHVWEHVRDYLEFCWKRDLSSVEYCCLPRGRVCQSQVRTATGGMRNDFVIYHGGDGPASNDDFGQVRAKFNLAANSRTAWDEHEQMLPEDIASLTAELGIDVRAALATKGQQSDEPFTARLFYG